MSERVGGIYYDVTLDTSQLIEQTRVVDREVNRAASAFNRITQAVKLYAAALALAKAINLADEMRLLAARVEVAAGSVENATAAMKELEAISRRTQTGIADNVAVFTRLNQSLQQMGGTQEDTLGLTELLGKAIKVSGASAVEAKAAMLQFGQALGSGKLAGDELRSLLENAPYLMRQLAEGIGVPVGSLKTLGEQGKLTADVVVNALTKASARINADFAKMPQTFAASVQVMEDAAARANKALDDVTGTSAVVSGAVQGLGTVFDSLARQLVGAGNEADKLGRNKTVEDWSTKTAIALSYVADAADMVYQTVTVLGRNVAFVFETLGSQIGGIGAMAAAAAQGNFAQARAIWKEMAADDAKRRAELDAKDADTLRDRLLAGQRIRQAIAANASAPEPDRLDQAAGRRRTTSRLTPPVGTVPTTGAKFDAEKYLAGLAEAAASEWERINAAEQEGLRRNAQLLAEGKITREQAAKAATLIEQDAAQKRLDIQLENAEKIRQQIEKGGEEETAAAVKAAEERATVLRQLEDEKAAEEAKRAQDRERGQQFAAGVITGADPIAALQAELEAKSALLAQYAEADQANAELYAQARVVLEQQTAEKITEIARKNGEQQATQNAVMLQNFGALFGSLADLTKGYAGEQSSTYRAMFAVSKAFSIAQSLVAIQSGIAQAANNPWPTNLAAMASVAASTAGIISAIEGVNFGGGRQYGGPVTGGSLYRVNEAGRPEMFTAANGSQYMLPTANGNVTPANEVGAGGGVQWQIIINNAPPGTSASVDSDARIVRVAVGEVANQIASNSGPVWSAMRGATNVQGRL